MIAVACSRLLGLPFRRRGGGLLAASRRLRMMWGCGAAVVSSFLMCGRHGLCVSHLPGAWRLRFPCLPVLVSCPGVASCASPLSASPGGDMPRVLVPVIISSPVISCGGGGFVLVLIMCLCRPVSPAFSLLIGNGGYRAVGRRAFLLIRYPSRHRMSWGKRRGM